MDGAVGSPKEKSGTKPAVEVALLAPSGAATPSIAPLPNRVRVLGDPFFEVVGHEGGHRRRAAGQQPEEEADAGRAQHRARCSA